MTVVAAAPPGGTALVTASRRLWWLALAVAVVVGAAAVVAPIVLLAVVVLAVAAAFVGSPDGCRMALRAFGMMEKAAVIARPGCGAKQSRGRDPILDRVVAVAPRDDARGLGLHSPATACCWMPKW